MGKFEAVFQRRTDNYFLFQWTDHNDKLHSLYVPRQLELGRIVTGETVFFIHNVQALHSHASVEVLRAEVRKLEAQLLRERAANERLNDRLQRIKITIEDER